MTRRNLKRARHVRSPSQVALRWLIQREGVLPTPGAKNATRAAQTAGALTFTLTDDEVRALSEATNFGQVIASLKNADDR